MQSVIDERVIAEWARRRADYRRRYRFVPYVLSMPFVVIVVMVALGMIEPWPMMILAPILWVLVLLLGRNHYQFVLKCPHCDAVVGSRFRRPTLIEFDHCPHCLYWLKNPRQPIG